MKTPLEEFRPVRHSFVVDPETVTESGILKGVNKQEIEESKYYKILRISKDITDFQEGDEVILNGGIMVRGLKLPNDDKEYWLINERDVAGIKEK